ncbi:Imm49 family immunity protein, partial [Sediminibacterium soli]|uniref:Imm49 family immunity protein n=1 Tax=Sediminibacterium soli TaxID=2698829 RepID=UPI001379A55E
MLPLSEIYTNSIISENEALKRILSPQTSPVQYESDIGMLWYYNEHQALGSLFLNKDIRECKQCFYRCGRIDEYEIKQYNSRVLDSGVIHITFAILSDDLSLIDRYANLTHPWFSHTIKKGSLVHAMQNIIKEDWDSLRGDIFVYEQIITTQKGKINIPDLMFFKGMLTSNKEMVTEAIKMLLKDHKKRNKHMGIAQDYISIPALGYTKLAWLKGMEIEIDHPLIPK